LASLGVFLTSLDVVVVATALPTLRTELHAGLSDLEWTINAYNLVFACLLLTGAALGSLGGPVGTIIGGIAGHFAGHHGLAGAAAGCAVGTGASHYMKSHNSRNSLQRDQQQITPPAMQQNGT